MRGARISKWRERRSITTDYGFEYTSLRLIEHTKTIKGLQLEIRPARFRAGVLELF